MAQQSNSNRQNMQQQNAQDIQQTPISSMNEREIVSIQQPESFSADDRPYPRMVGFLLDWNIFASDPPTTDPYKLQTQRIATRVFVVSFLFAFFILLIYSSINTTNRTITIQTPDLVQYDHLFSLHPTTLSCPCSQISVEYRSFVQIDFVLHPMCYSDFITEQWMLYLQAVSVEVSIADFRAIGGFYFRALQSLCQLSEDTINDSLDEFLTQDYIATRLTGRKTLNTEVSASIEQFISTTTNRFTSFLQMIMDTSQVNGLVSAFVTNYGFYFDMNSGYIWPRVVVYDDECICYENSQCTSKLFILDAENSFLSWHVPGFYRGCFIIQALRKSQLGCFYNQTCLEELEQHFQSTLPFTPTPLNASQLLHFNTNTTIGSIIDQLMVDQWNGSEIFAHYYHACSPKKCSYTIVTRDNLIGIVVTLVGLIGGLITILKLVVPHTVNAIRLMIKAKTTSKTGMIQSDAYLFH